MFKIDGPNATPENEFTKGPPATEVTDEWLNAVQRELVNFIESTGITLDKTNDSQLLQAIGIEIWEAGEDIDPREAIRIRDDAGTVKAFLADNTSVLNNSGFRGFSASVATVTTGNPVLVARHKLGGFSGLSPGDLYYLSSTPGASTNIATTLTLVSPIARAINDTTFEIVKDYFYKYPLVIKDSIELPGGGISRVYNNAGVFERVNDYEDFFISERWSPEAMGLHDIFFEAPATGGAAAPFTIAFLFEGTSTEGIVFQTSTIVIGNQSANELSWLGFNVKTGNVTNWDPTTQGLGGINDAVEQWEVQIAADVGAGAGYAVPFMKLLMFEREIIDDI